MLGFKQLCAAAVDHGLYGGDLLQHGPHLLGVGSVVMFTLPTHNVAGSHTEQNL